VNPRYGLPLAILLGLVVRVPFWIEALRTPVDGDTAIVGLMARHPGQGTTLWGQPYGSPLESWLAAPFVAALGPTTEALRLFYFLLGLALIPAAYTLAGRLDGRAALPAAIVVACPPPYFLLLASLPPPLYPSVLVILAYLLALTLRLGDRFADEAPPPMHLRALAGVLAGLALWTHLMSAGVIAACAVFLFARARGRRRLLAPALLALLACSAPLWVRALTDGSAIRIVSVSDRRQTTLEHLREVLPRLHEPLGGLLGSHVPMVADDPEFVVWSPRAVAAAAIFIYGACLVFAARSLRDPHIALLLAAAGLTVLAFPFPLRSGPATLRFLTPLYLPVAALVAWVTAARIASRRAWIVVLVLCGLHLGGSTRLLQAWRNADRRAAPFLLPDLAPVREALERHGIRRAYASYGPAYRLTYESGERVVVSQPWNERFLHHPLPYLDEVRFAVRTAWVLTPRIPSDLPAPSELEAALGRGGGTWRRTDVPGALVYHDFVPPYAAQGTPLPGAGAAGDGDLRTALAPSAREPTLLRLPAPTALDAVTLIAGLEGPRLLRSMDVEVSADGVTFEVVAQRRRRGEREDLRWVNGHPQFVLDHDLLSIPLGGRTVAALRVSPIASSDPWRLAEVMIHPATGTRFPWDDPLDPALGWRERRRTLIANPRADREDWYYRRLLAERH
jgi:4-amino-4-deoxy-L-arabinose transferase-like glycosyltransferase